MAVAYDAKKAERVREKYRKLYPASDKLLPLIVPDAIADDPDGLIPWDKADAPLAIGIPLFSNRNFLLKDGLTVEWLPNSSTEWQLIWAEEVPNYNELPDSSFPLPREIPLVIFSNYQGTFQVRYRITSWNAAIEDRESTRPITIDRIGPIRPGTPQAVEGTPPVVTTDILNRDSGLKCVIPDFVEDKKESVRVQIGLMERPPESEDEFPALVVFSGLLPDHREVLIPRNFVENIGSKLQYIVYYLFDKAGNRSERSYDKGVQVALGELPNGLSPCRVPLAEDGFIDRADGATPLWVEIDEYGGWQTSDSIAILFGDQTPAQTAVGAHGRFPLRISISWRYVAGAYDFTLGGAQPIDVDYVVYRGNYPTRSPAAIRVVLNLAVPGPGSPDPEPINPRLDKLRFESFSGSATELTLADRGKDAMVRFNLPDDVLAGDVFTLYYNNRPVSLPPYTVLGSEAPNVEIPLVIPWADIELTPVMDGLEMYYLLTRPGFANPQESERTLIDVLVEVVDLPEPIFLNAADVGGGYKIFNCSSLVADGSGSWGVKVQIPTSIYLKAGVTVKFHWQTFGAGGSTPLPGTQIDEEREVTAEEEVDGMDWFLEYDKYLKPTYIPGVSGDGMGEASYGITVRGADESSALVIVFTGMFETVGGGHDHCVIPRP